MGVLNEIKEDPFFVLKAIKVKMVFSSTYYIKGDKKVEFDRSALATSNLEVVMGEHNMRFGNWPETLSGIVGKLHSEFNEMLVSLAEGCFDENFWKGAGRD